MYKVALIGCGRIAANHLEAISNNRDKIQLVAICDLVVEKLNEKIKLIKKLGLNNVRTFTDYKKMIDEVECDEVSIATDSGSHAEIAIYCMNKGKHVLVEKPMALSVDDAEQMIKVSNNKNVYLGVCYQNRYNEAIKYLRRAIEEKRFGKIVNITSLVWWNRDESYYQLDKWRGTWKDDGGCLMNQSIHNVDMLQWMADSETVNVFGKIVNNFHRSMEAEDFATGIVEFKNGIIGVIEGTVCVYPNNYKETISIIGQDGFVEIGGTSLNKIECWKFKDNREYDNEVKKVISHEQKGIYGIGHSFLYNDFFCSIENGKRFMVNGEEGIKSLKIILATYKSSKTSRKIEMENFKFSTIDMNKKVGI